MKHSRRYREIKEQIRQHPSSTLEEILEFLRQNNREKIKNIKVSLALNWNKQEKKNVLRQKIILPYPLPVKEKLAVVKDNLSPDIIKSLAKNKSVELLSVEEVHQRVIVEETSKIRKKSQWGFKKILVHPQSEKSFKLPKKSSLSLFRIVARQTIASENTLEEVKKFQQGETELKTDLGGNIQAVVGKSDFSLAQLEQNWKTIHNSVVNLKPLKWKGNFFRKITLSTTMGPGLKVLV